MERNMRPSYVHSGPRSLPHMGNNAKRFYNSISNSRLSPPAQPNILPHNNNNSNNNNNNNNNSSNNTHNLPNNSQHDDLIQYIYESWNKVTREVERGGEEAKYYQESAPPRHLANFRPINLEELWARRLVQSFNRRPRS